MGTISNPVAGVPLCAVETVPLPVLEVAWWDRGVKIWEIWGQWTGLEGTQEPRQPFGRPRLVKEEGGGVVLDSYSSKKTSQADYDMSMGEAGPLN